MCSLQGLHWLVCSPWWCCPCLCSTRCCKDRGASIPSTRGPWQDGHELIAHTELPGNSLTSETSSYQGSIFPKSRQHGLGVLQDAALLGKVPLHPSSGPIADLCSERFSTCWTNATVGLPSDAHTFCRDYAAAPFVEANIGPCLHHEVAFL